MDVESLAKQLILKGMTEEQQKAILDSIKTTMTQARTLQKQRVGENVQVVVQALKKLEADIRERYDEVGNKIEARVATIKDGKDGRDGSNGKDGKDGRPGRDGGQGPRGADGLNGNDGRDGTDGVSVTDAHIDFDGSLIISLSSGRTINVGEVVAPDLAEKIKVITNGGGTSQQVLDTLASLQTQIDNLIPSQTSNAGKFLTTNGSVLSWGDVAGGLDYQGAWNASTNTPTLVSSTGTNGYYYVVSVAGSTNLDGITDWKAGDWVIFNGTAWQKIDQSWAIAGVNDNITSMTGLTGGISSPDFIQFDTTATVTDATGRLYYDDADMYQTLAFQMNGNVIQHVGEELFYRVKLSASATKGQVLMFTGTLGASGGLIAAPATGLTFEQSNYLLGLAGESGSTNDWITVYEFGEIRGVNTSAFTQGQVLYYNPAVTGGLTATKPSTPNAIATMAAVVHVGTSNGVLFVRPTFGSALGGTDGNVRFGTLASGNTIIYDAVDGVWKNANLTDGTGISITEGAGSITVTNTAPDQTVVLTQGGTTTITGTYPNFTISSDDQYDGTVTSVGGTGTVNGISLSGTVTSSGNLTLGGALSGVDLTTQVAGTLPIANGGTNATTAADARTSLGLGTLATQNASSVAITGGSINGTTVGATTASSGAFTSLSATGVTTVQAGTNSAPAITTSGDTNTGIFFPAADQVAITTGGTQRAVVDASGNVGIGTSSPAHKLHVAGNAFVPITNSYYCYTSDFGMGTPDSDALQIFAGAGNSIRFGNRVSGTFTERARITAAGDVLIGTTASGPGNGNTTVGIELAADGQMFVSSAAAPVFFNRNVDGTVVSFSSAGTAEGTISISGTTTSYNGGHLSRWAQTTTAKDESLVKGTVMSNLDEMNVYVDAAGNPVANEQLNKVKVSDVEGDANVAGVFVNWTHDDAHNVDEINMAMTGDMIIRIAQGVTVQRGDLLMSAGDGTAKPQGDDIVRSKTIAKVTSTHITCTYADGSFCVPCVLMAC